MTEIANKYKYLPASQIADAVNEALQKDGGAVITAPPGAGKSTLLPLTILEGLQGDGKILMLEPRRLAARQIAERMADMLGEEVGNTVGYRVRFEKKVSKGTRIEVLTEGILTRMLTNDATLEGVDVVVFDEYHERSINSDLSLALTRLAKDILRPDLKIVVMSATIDADLICKTLDLPLIESEGKMFPVEISNSNDDIDIYYVPSAVASMIRKAHSENEGSILAFLPGQGEIQKCADMLEGTLGDTHVYPLYGNLPPEQQRKAIAPMKDGERKIVLATPIAETSLTIEGIRIVVDSGLRRKLVFDGRTGLSHLVTVRISKDMATQRAGRAGRLTDGVCYRLWTKVSESRMEEQRKPEILEADLAPMVLDLAAFGESDVESLPWMTVPERDAVYRAKALLQSLGAIDAKGTITETGKQMVSLPCHPRVSRMILHANNDKQKSLACDIAALLEEKDPMSDNQDTDISLRVSALRKARNQKNIGRWSRIAKIAEEYHRMVHVNIGNTDIAPKEVGAIVAYAYPERIAKAWDNSGMFRLASGDNVYVDMTDSMSAQQWIAIASANLSAQTKGRVFLAAPLDMEDIAELQTERDNVSWDSKELKVLMQHERRIGKLLIDTKPIHNAPKKDIVDIICEATKKDGLSLFDWDEDVQRLQRRVAKVAEWHPELNLPDFSTEHLMQTADEWLPMYVETNGRIATSASELKKINLCEVLMGMLYNYQSPINPDENGVTILDRYAPLHIQVPTGSRIRIDYRLGADAPVLSVRLQECFGMEDTPTVNDGKQPLLMELLSPGFKPVQLTQDLRSFWNGTYFEVSKELKRRYPKHYWPENPLEAEAVRGVKPKQQNH
ncbi:MAG: ATP-dependent helicase HrpB [Prevotella sp.]|nr:ATP-dependent helicase HrpB [Prevotella sp.]